jgi:hypothetical protein
MFPSGFTLLSLVKTKLFNLYLNCEFEKKSIKKTKKYKPPNHCELDLHKIKVGSKYLILLKIEKPVPVIPDTDSNNELIKGI